MNSEEFSKHRNRRILLLSCISTCISLIFVLIGVWIIRGYLSRINELSPFIYFDPDIGALFAVGSLLVFSPVAVPRFRRWIYARVRWQHALMFLFLSVAVVSFVAVRWGFEAYLNSSSYYKCGDHTLLHENRKRKQFFDPQVWVLDPKDCLVP